MIIVMTLKDAVCDFVLSPHCSAKAQVAREQSYTDLYIMLEIHHSGREPSIYRSCPNTLGACHMQHVCHVMQRDSSAIKLKSRLFYLDIVG